MALVTPFDTNHEVDYNALKKTVNHVIKGGVNYLVVLGTTAETPTLSTEEKEKLVQVVKEENEDLPVVMGMGSNNTSEVVKKIKSQNFDGIDAILSVTPWYNKPNQEGVFRHFAAIAEVSPVPIILYNVPGRTSSNISSHTCLRLAHDYPEKIVGVKEASGDMKQIMEILAGKPESFHVISGDDAITPAMIALGGSGVISVIANAFPSQFSTMVRYALEGNHAEARNIHFPLLPVIDAMFAEGNPAGVKAFMRLQGILDDNVRLPLIKVSDSLEEKIRKLHEDMKSGL